MMEMQKCPRCGSALVVQGSISMRSWFRPQGLKFFSLSFQFPEVKIPSEAAACAGCGLVWAELDAGVLRQKLHDLGSEEIKRHLGIQNGS
jgi:hypothetical protein